jgi:hypothetical protein
MIINSTVIVDENIDAEVSEDERIHLYLGKVSVSMNKEEAIRLKGLLNTAIQQVEERENV